MFQDLSSLTHTHKTLCTFNSPFSLFALLLLYKYLPIYNPSCHPMSNTHGQKMMSFTFDLRQHQPSSNIVILSYPNSYELAITKERELVFYIE